MGGCWLLVDDVGFAFSVEWSQHVMLLLQRQMVLIQYYNLLMPIVAGLAAAQCAPELCT
jgi:hypothetical protein